MQYIAYFVDEEGATFSQFAGMHDGDSSAMGEARFLARQMGVRAIRVVEA